MKDAESYRGYYCGLCQELHKRYGRVGQMLLNYDMTFLVLLLTGLYEPKEEQHLGRCVAHPAQKHSQIRNEITGYAADMTVLLAYRKALDDWRDEKSRPKRVLAMTLYPHYKELRQKYPRQARMLESCIRRLSAAELEGSSDLDYVAGLTGKFLGELFVWKEDVWQEELRALGFYLGKFIYLMDAWEDMEKDQKKGNYNIFLDLKNDHPDTFGEEAEAVLVDMMTQCSRIFERLPVIYRADILRNILYSGVWCKYRAIEEQRKKKK